MGQHARGLLYIHIFLQSGFMLAQFCLKIQTEDALRWLA